MNRVYPPDEPSRRASPVAPPPSGNPDALDTLLREVRRLLAQRQYDEAITRLEVHRPAEWAALDGGGVKLLRLLGQAYLGKGEFRAARECLEHLRALERERPLLSRDERGSALSDLVKCYRSLGLSDLADDCLNEARRLQQEG